MRLTMRSAVRGVSLFLILFFSAFTSLAGAQSGDAKAALEGTILDPDGKAVVGAAVVIRNEATGDIITTSTDGNGRFAAARLPQGAYAIEVFVPGFDAIRRTGVQVKEETPTTVSIRLSVANISETVTVSAALPAAAVAALSQA